MGAPNDEGILANGKLDLIAKIELVKPHLGDSNAAGVPDSNDPGADSLIHL
jgi:hypothetical protein